MRCHDNTFCYFWCFYLGGGGDYGAANAAAANIYGSQMRGSQAAASSQGGSQMTDDHRLGDGGPIDGFQAQNLDLGADSMCRPQFRVSVGMILFHFFVCVRRGEVQGWFVLLRPQWCHDDVRGHSHCLGDGWGGGGSPSDSGRIARGIFFCFGSSLTAPFSTLFQD